MERIEQTYPNNTIDETDKALEERVRQLEVEIQKLKEGGSNHLFQERSNVEQHTDVTRSDAETTLSNETAIDLGTTSAIPEEHKEAAPVEVEQTSETTAGVQASVQDVESKPTAPSVDAQINEVEEQS